MKKTKPRRIAPRRKPLLVKQGPTPASRRDNPNVREEVEMQYITAVLGMMTIEERVEYENESTPQERSNQLLLHYSQQVPFQDFADSYIDPDLVKWIHFLLDLMTLEDRAACDRETISKKDRQDIVGRYAERASLSEFARAQAQAAAQAHTEINRFSQRRFPGF